MIFYFTATGNSKYIADKIAAAIGDTAINITACVQIGQFSFEIEDGETVGFVVPVYGYGIPLIVSEFLDKLTISADHNYYSYAILNCGGSTGDAERYIKQAFNLDAVFGIFTVNNYVPLSKIVSETKINEQLDKADIEINKFIERINARESGNFNTVKGMLPNFLTPVIYSIFKQMLKTSKFSVSDKCSGCGLCETLCPREVIERVNKKPTWIKPECELCLACLHRCPVSAIEYGRSAGRGRYVNPRVEW